MRYIRGIGYLVLIGLLVAVGDWSLRNIESELGK